MTLHTDTPTSASTWAVKLKTRVQNGYAGISQNSNAVQAAQDWATSARGWWAQRDRREQRLLAACALFLALAALWMLGLRPALRTIDAQRQALPSLRAEVAYVQSVVQQAQALATHRVGMVPESELDEAIQSSLRQAGLDTVLQVSSTDDDQTRLWTLSLASVPAARVIAWLSSTPDLLQLDTRSVALQRAMVQGRERPGLLDGQIVLARSAKES